jgi:hypothetical protein
MAIPVLIIGKSGSGKSASLRNFKPGEVGIINVMGKPLPFKTSLKTENTTNYSRVLFALKGAKVPALVIDDAGYLITHEFMSRHANTGKGNAVFELYNDLADQFYSLIRLISEEMPPEKIVYLLMHEEKSDSGDIKPKTIGKLLDEKVCLEGLFTIVLRAVGDQAKHVFMTQSSGFDIAKSPMGMFDTIEIDNDLKAVDTAIREYYGIKQEVK